VLFQLRPNNPLAAPLQPGRRLYIGVRAAQFPTTTNETFRIGIQPNGCGFVLPTVLAAGESFSEVAFPAAPEDPGTTYQTTATAASSVEFSAEGTLTLLASNGTEPTMANYQLRQTVSNGSATLQLPGPGTWYFRVVNETAAAVPYTISVAGQGESNVLDVSIVDDHLRVTWQSVAGTSYEIATSTDLVNWEVLTTIEATAGETTYTDPNAATGTARFIRIRPL
jgi:hypothetical protein